MSNGNACFNLFSMPRVPISSVCFLLFRLVSKVNPRKLNSSILSTYISSVVMADLRRFELTVNARLEC